MVDAAQHLRDRRRAARLQQVLEDGAVLPGQRQGLAGKLVQLWIGRGLDGDPQGTRPLHGGAVQDAAVQALEGGGAPPVWQPPRLVDVGHGADPRVAAVNSRYEQHEAVDFLGGRDRGARCIRLDGNRQRHVRQYHAIVEREEGQEQWVL